MRRKYEKYISYWISEPDKGIYNAMNKGIKIANGQWINFMNAGDCFYDENVLSEIFSRNDKSNNKKIIYGDVIQNRNGKKKYCKALNIKKITRSIICCHQSMFISSLNIQDILYDEKFMISSDYKMIYDIFFKYGEKVFLYVPIPISVFEANDGISSRYRQLLFKEQLMIRRDKKDLIWYIDFFRYKFRVFFKYLISHRINKMNLFS